MRKLLLPLVLLSFTACNSEDVKPKELQGNWTFVSGTYANICVNGETTHSGPGSCSTSRGTMPPQHMEISKTEIVKINGADPTLRTVSTYTVKGKVVTGTYKNGGDTYKMTVKELTDDKLSIHEDYIRPSVGINYTKDAVYKR